MQKLSEPINVYDFLVIVLHVQSPQATEGFSLKELKKVESGK